MFSFRRRGQQSAAAAAQAAVLQPEASAATSIPQQPASASPAMQLQAQAEPPVAQGGTAPTSTAATSAGATTIAAPPTATEATVPQQAPQRGAGEANNLSQAAVATTTAATAPTATVASTAAPAQALPQQRTRLRPFSRQVQQPAPVGPHVRKPPPQQQSAAGARPHTPSGSAKRQLFHGEQQPPSKAAQEPIPQPQPKPKQLQPSQPLQQRQQQATIATPSAQTARPVQAKPQKQVGPVARPVQQTTGTTVATHVGTRSLRQQQDQQKRQPASQGHAHAIQQVPEQRRQGPQEHQGSNPRESQLALRVPIESRVLNMHIHRTDVLKPELTLVSPIVRVHVLSEEGQYLSKSDPKRNVVYPNEHREYIQPFQTRAYFLKDRKADDGDLVFDGDVVNTRGGRPLVASWEEAFLINEKLDHLENSGCKVFFEILQLPPITKDMQTNWMKDLHHGVYEIAWGFLKLKSSNGESRIGKVQRLQLYKYRKNLPSHLRSRNVPNVFKQWLDLFNSTRRVGCMGGSRPRRRNLYHSSLYVSMSSQEAPHERIRVTSHAVNVRQGDVPFRPTLPTDTEEGRLTVDQMISDIMPITSLSGEFSSEGQLNEKERWRERRMDLQWKTGSPCMVPNVLDRSVPGGSHGTSMIAFSHDGMMLAVACAEGTNYSIKVFSVATGHELGSLQGHHDLIYNICWSKDGTMLASASSDLSAKIWSTEGLDAKFAECKSKDALVVPVQYDATLQLQHPSFVYCVDLHPKDNLKIVVTGCYDRCVRLWSATSGVILGVLSLGSSHINSICFNNTGRRLYCGDGDGVVSELSCEVSSEDSASLTIKQANNQLQGASVCHVKLSPNQKSLNILCHGNVLAALDLKQFRIATRYPSIKCNRLPMKMANSPDGRFLLSGSEDNRVYLWDAHSTAVYSLSFLQVRSEPIICCAWSPTEHVLAVCSFDVALPVSIFRFSRDLPPVIVGREGRKATLPRLPPPVKRDAMIRSRPVLPDRLTPENVSQVLNTIRADHKQMAARRLALLRAKKERAASQIQKAYRNYRKRRENLRRDKKLSEIRENLQLEIPKVSAPARVNPYQLRSERRPLQRLRSERQLRDKPPTASRQMSATRLNLKR